jgi:hypothetical protein
MSATRRRVGLAVAVFAGALLAPGGPAAVAGYIVSNLQEPIVGSQFIGAFYNTSTDIGGGGQLAQQFSTGDQSYLLDSVTMSYQLSVNGSGMPGNTSPALSVALYADSGDAPGDRLTTFSLSPTNSFVFAPDDPNMVLAPESSYWFALSLTPSRLTQPSLVILRIGQTGSLASTGPGSLGPSRKVDPGGTVTNWLTQAFQVGVSGTPVPEIDPGAASGGLTLLAGGLLILTGRRGARRRSP